MQTSSPTILFFVDRDAQSWCSIWKTSLQPTGILRLCIGTWTKFFLGIGWEWTKLARQPPSDQLSKFDGENTDWIQFFVDGQDIGSSRRYTCTCGMNTLGNDTEGTQFDAPCKLHTLVKQFSSSPWLGLLF